MKRLIMHLKKNENNYNDNDKKIYASMAQISDNDKRSIRDFGESLKFTN